MWNSLISSRKAGGRLLYLRRRASFHDHVGAYTAGDLLVALLPQNSQSYVTNTRVLALLRSLNRFGRTARAAEGRVVPPQCEQSTQDGGMHESSFVSGYVHLLVGASILGIT